MNVSPTPTDIGRGTATRSATWAKNGMVACAQPLAALAGIEMLKRGGTAVDAAIATNACLGVMEPTANGIGGDLFAIVWDPATRALAGINASGRAPLRMAIEVVPPTPEGTIPLHSPYAWSVPGCVDGWFALHDRFGRLPMNAVLEPAIDYATSGFPVSAHIAWLWNVSAGLHAGRAGFSEVFLPDGQAPREGDTFRNPALARSLQSLVEGGRDAFYRGPIASAIVRFSEANGGFFSNEDFTRHRSTWDDPICTSYRGLTLWEMPPNSQGLAAIQLLNILENFDLRTMGRDSADFWHVCIEAKKLAFADRARYYTDPAFAAIPVSELMSKDYARTRSKRIDMQRAAETDSPRDPVALNRPETTYLCTADREGMMVSLIQSNYTGFGSGYAVPEVGFGLQNRGALFALDPAHANRLEPGKRPFQTIIPAFVTRDGEPYMAFGVMGGDMQPQGHAQVVANLADFDMSLQEAGDALRFYHTGSSEPTGTTMSAGGLLHLEAGLPPSVVEDLRDRGHRIAHRPTAAFGGYQAIRWHADRETYEGATEMRKDGVALGY